MIQIDRIRTDIEAIARFTETPGTGATRPTFSDAWAEARKYIQDQAQAAGCQWKTDAAGNCHARPAQLESAEAAWLCGSHIDTVPHGGNYDGVTGVIIALEILRSAKEDGIAIPFELIVFAEEEGTTFGLGMIGSRAWVGELNESRLRDLKNAHGQTYIEAGRPFGVDPARLQILRPAEYLGFIEVHIEQGPAMWRNDQRLAVVRAIAGRRQYRVKICGEANHAGATPMTHRKDTLCGVAEIVLGLERLAPKIASDAVATVGRLTNHPNAVNVIPDIVEFTIDFRAPQKTMLESGDAEIRQRIARICTARDLRSEIQLTESIDACPMDHRLCDALARIGNIPSTVSGALHDSAIIAPRIPTAMLFVPSRDGISHNPAEFSRIEDIAAATTVVEQLVRRPTFSRLSRMDSPDFVTVCGGIFEHSPWIAQEAWKSRPFSSLSDLHEKLIAVVKRASAQQKLDLIKAHPDLVGRLAREGKLTAASTAEQSAAGLTALSAEEIAAFESNNEKYRNKFGFPFIICARQNRKEAILKAFASRLANTRDAEIAAALTEIFKIAQLRLADAVWET